MTSENIKLTALNDNATSSTLNKVSQLTSCGLSLLPLPTFGSVSQADTTPKVATFKVTLNPKLKLPGSDKTLSLTIDAGSISIQIPRVPLPELVLFGRSFMPGDPKGDVLVVADPITSQYLPSLDLVSRLWKFLKNDSNELVDPS